MPERLVASLEGPQGAPVVVLGNSLGTTRAVWEPQVAALSGRFRLLRYEHRGHGGSPAPPGPYDIVGLATDVLKLLNEFGVEAASYCGISMGGMIGMWLAAHVPDRIASAVGCSRLRVIRGGAHLANVSHPGEVTAALMEHLTRPPRRP